MKQKKQTELKKIEPPLPIYSIFITNGKDRVFYGMMVKEDAYSTIKQYKPEELLNKIDKELSGDLKAIVEERLP